MKIGFIGAGKVGSSFGHYLKDHGIHVVGYASMTFDSAVVAAEFTGTGYFNVDELIEISNYIFITTPDDVISKVWNQIKKFDLQGKKIFHMSGSLSSSIFEDIESHGASGYSLHPLFPITDKYSYKRLDNAIFTIEGKNIASIEGFLRMSKVNYFRILDANKAKYHAAAVFASNYVISLAKISKSLLTDCGIPQNDADKAICSLMEGTISNIKENGIEDSLTGPIIRGDIGTVRSHINAVSEYMDIYQGLGKIALDIARERNSLNEEKVVEMMNVLGGEIDEKNSSNI